jgi:hypothetical protein
MSEHTLVSKLHYIAGFNTRRNMLSQHRSTIWLIIHNTSTVSSHDLDLSGRRLQSFPPHPRSFLCGNAPHTERVLLPGSNLSSYVLSDKLFNLQNVCHVLDRTIKPSTWRNLTVWIKVTLWKQLVVGEIMAEGLNKSTYVYLLSRCWQYWVINGRQAVKQYAWAQKIS